MERESEVAVCAESRASGDRHRLAFLVASDVHAQASISGLVQDATGAVLPGVAIEASSPASIEKVRTATTDGAGRYTIVDSRPGITA